MPRIKETPLQGRMRAQREQEARWAAEAAARATEEAEAAAPTALPAPVWQRSLMSAEALDANDQGEEENALVMTSREIKEMRRAEKAIRKKKKREKKEKKKRKRPQEAGGSRYVPRSYLS